MSVAKKPDWHFYCEFLETDARWLGDWAEPLNTLSNALFPLIGIWVLYRWLQRPKQFDMAWLGIMLICIGLGSGWWHMTQSGVEWDMMPVLAFLLSFMAIWVWRFTEWQIEGMKWMASLAIMVLYLLMSVGLGIITYFLTQHPLATVTATYASTFLFIAFIGLYSREEGFPYAGAMVAAAPLFLLALTFRTLDGPLCHHTHGFGLHPLWHLFNGAALYFAMRFMLENVQERAMSAR